MSENVDRPAHERGLDPLADALWPDVDRSDRRVLLWPIGSTEQHGPHLPLGTDSVIAGELAGAIHARHPAIGLAPCLPVGASGEHAAFAGTLSIGTEALTSLVVEFVRHATGFWQHVVAVNGHGGNADALAGAARILDYEGRSFTVHHAASNEPGGDAHAGHRETSLMLHLRPGSVRMDLAEPGATQPLSTLMPGLRTGGVRAVSVNGILGDPSGANTEHGRRVFESMCAALDRRVTELLRT